MKNTEDGFTLIESLLTLSIFLLISSITVFMVKPHFNHVESKTFLTQFSADLYYAQQYSISHQRELTFIFATEQHFYYIQDRYDLPLVLIRYYSDNVTITPGTLPLRFKFLSDGNTNNFGTLFINCGTKQYKMTFLIGKGRFYVVEE